MSHLADAFASLQTAGLSASDQELVLNELRVFREAVESRDEAALSASVEVVTELCQRYSLIVVIVPVLRAFIEATANNVRRGYAWMNLSTIYYESRDLPQAEKALDHAEAIFAGENDSEGTASAYLIRGQLWSDLGDADRARRFLGDALALSRRKHKRLRARESLTSLEFDAGNHDSARLACEAWLTESGQSEPALRDDLIRMLHMYGLIGRRYLLLGDRSAAQAIADRCVRVAELNSVQALQICRELLDALGDAN